jgi:DNA mismatch repair protein MutL
MGIIRQLDAHLSNMIAAGEVIERPAAIVKELVENALDAQAKHIEVRMQQGGLEALEVFDDGVGMDFSDAGLAFSRHSTSKIKHESDLFAPQSLGFRGEALPSIAAVSRVVLETHHQGQSTRVRVEYGDMVSYEITEAMPGTRFWIEGLFARTPARLKHLRSPQKEASAIAQVLERFILSRPDVAFVLKNEDKTLLNSPGSGHLMDALAAVYGNQIARQSTPFEAEDYDYKIRGVWAHPQTHRSSAWGIQTFINHRMIRSYALQQAVVEAFRDHIPAHRYPICVIHIDVDPQLVDVNVHPSKWEVRLSKEGQLRSLIVSSLSAHLKTTLRPSEATHTLSSRETMSDVNVQETESVPFFHESLSFDFDDSTQSFPALDLIGQMHGRFVLASSEDSLYLIDQHAAKERINYEQILTQLNAPEQHQLLVPLIVETSVSLMARFEAFCEHTRALNLELDPLSQTSYVVRAVPLWMQTLELEPFMQDLHLRFEQNARLDEAALRDEVVANLACHKSVRFNQVLNHHEMLQILKELSQCEQPYHCPHGRPTLVRLSANALWKDFER